MSRYVARSAFGITLAAALCVSMLCVSVLCVSVLCAFSTTPAIAGTTQPAHSTYGGSQQHATPHQQKPLLPSQLYPALRKYRTYVHHKITALVPAVRKLHSRLEHGDVKAAKRAWLTARLVWLRIGQDNSAYGIFGDLGQHIDGTAAGHPRGVHDPAFTGFHRIERDLWRAHNLAAARADATKLDAAVTRLSHLSMKQVLPANLDGVTGFVLRSHEVIEDAVRDTLSGNDEYGSGTALASVIADVNATREVLGLLAPLLKHRAPGLVKRSRHDLSHLVAVAKTGRHHGHWTPVKALSRHQREVIDAAAGAADEDLAPVPDALRTDNA